MAPTPQQLAEAALRPHAQLLNDIVRDSFADWHKRPHNWRAGRRSRASFMFDQMGEVASERFDGLDGVTITRRYGVVHLGLQNGRYDVRFKKLNSDGSINFNKTVEQLRLFHQVTIPGMLVEHLVIGYIVSEDETSIERIEVCFHDHGRNIPVWSFDLASILPVQKPVAAIPPKTAAQPRAGVTVKTKAPKPDTAASGQ